MGVKGGVSEAFPVVFSEEFAVFEQNVIDLVSRAAAVQLLPLLVRRPALPAGKRGMG